VSFTIAASLDDALAALATGARPIAGGTDLVVSARHGTVPLPDDLVAIDRLEELRSVAPGSDGSVSVGALVSHAMLMVDPTIVGRYTALADAAALVGSPATRHVGTLGGNIMNASPAMDTGAPLTVLDASAVLRSTSGERTLPIGDLWEGPGVTAARSDELCTSVVLPPRPDRSASAYVRLEYRRAMEIAVVGAAAAVTLTEDGAVVSLSVALAAVAPTIVSVPVDGLVGRRIDGLSDDVARLASECATPIADLRASERYRRHTVGVMARRAVDAAARRASGESIDVPVNRAVGIGAAS
jgi:aerobic carbon-monoxide dehydrogenase medium subunit